MHIGRGFAPEKAVNIGLLSRRKQEVAAAGPSVNAHEQIVTNHGELVCPGSVGAAQNEIATFFGNVYRLVAVNGIVKLKKAVRDVKADGITVLVL